MASSGYRRKLHGTDYLPISVELCCLPCGTLRTLCPSQLGFCGVAESLDPWVGPDAPLLSLFEGLVRCPPGDMNSVFVTRNGRVFSRSSGVPIQGSPCTSREWVE